MPPGITKTTWKFNEFATLGPQFRSQKNRHFWTAKNGPKNVTFFWAPQGAFSLEKQSILFDLQDSWGHIESHPLFSMAKVYLSGLYERINEMEVELWTTRRAWTRYIEYGDKLPPTLKLQKSLQRMTFRQSAYVGNAQKKVTFFGSLFSGPKNDVFWQANFVA